MRTGLVVVHKKRKKKQNNQQTKIYFRHEQFFNLFYSKFLAETCLRLLFVTIKRPALKF